jgi:hypothetical protein
MNPDEIAQPEPDSNPNDVPNIEPKTAAEEMGNWETLLEEIADRSDLDPDDDDELEALERLEFVEISTEIGTEKAQLDRLQTDITKAQASFGAMMQQSIVDLERRHQQLAISVEQLERKRDRIEQEIKGSFPGASQDMAIRIQGFKDYLVGSLQDLVSIAEEVEFPTPPPPPPVRIEIPPQQSASANPPQFSEPAFKSTAKKIEGAIATYRSAPDYYAPPWELRRTLEAKHADRISTWFFKCGGRGSIKGSSSRLQNILVAAGAISILRDLYGEDLRTLILANLPERLGDWRRGLQDCLGIAKSDFGGGGGVILFENPNALVQKADRLLEQGEMPLVIIDDSEGLVSLSLLQYPLWLAFVPPPQQQVDDYRY